jgi:hypothetical protein
MPGRFVSWTFLVGFGIGSFVGVALALLAVALAKPEPTVEESIIEITATPGPTRAPSEPSATPTPSIHTTAAIEVRVGPGEAYAIIGSIDRGVAVSVLGRNDPGDWLAISYPPGSAARGWLPAGSLEGLNARELTALAVLVPTPFARVAPTTSVDFGFTPFPGSTSVTGAVPDSTADPRTPRPTATSEALHVGPTDLTVVGITLNPDGSVRVTIGNTGPGDVAGSTISVLVSAGADAETLFIQTNLRAGSTVDVSTSRIHITKETEVTATIDPSNLLSDTNRGNNHLYATLVPKPTPAAALPAQPRPLS